MFIEKKMEQFNSVDLKKIFRNISCHSPHWPGSKWKAYLAGRRENKKRFQYCTDSSGIIVYFRALQGHSRRNLINPSFHDNVINMSNSVRSFCIVSTVLD